MAFIPSHRLKLLCRASALLCAALAMATAGSTAYGQVHGRYFPLNQDTPPGVAGQWAGIVGKADGRYYQPIRVEVPGNGRVTFFGPDQQPLKMPVENQAGLLVGHVYRIKISDIPNFPGVELYPSVELIDRLHPPRGRANDFPIPITFSNQEIELAADGRMITKVVYLEQPQLASPIKRDATVPVDIIHPSDNAIAAADRMGRPMAIVRLGGRVPLFDGSNDGFFGDHAPLAASIPAKQPKPAITEAPQLILR